MSSYSGTYVVSSATGALSSARIEHSCEGGVQLERVEALTGEPRVTFRRNESVLTYMPASRVVYSERRDLRGVFPNLLQPGLEAFEVTLVGRIGQGGWPFVFEQVSHRRNCAKGSAGS